MATAVVAALRPDVAGFKFPDGGPANSCCLFDGMICVRVVVKTLSSENLAPAFTCSSPVPPHIREVSTNLVLFNKVSVNLRAGPDAFFQL